MIEDERLYGEKLGERIALARGGKSQVLLAKELGVNKNTLLGYEKGRVIPDILVIRKICDICSVDWDWLVGDVNKNRASDSGSTKTARLAEPLEPCNAIDNQPCLTEDNGKICIPRWRDPDPDMFDYIPMADAQLSAGGGCFVISENIEGYYAFRKSWISRVATSVKNLVLMRVHGRSMDPTIQDADTVMIDTGRRDIREGMIYALRVDSTIMIKRLSFRTGGKVFVISDNRQEYEPYEAAIKELFIIGQIIFIGRTFVSD